MRCGFGSLENLKVYSRVCVSNMPAHGYVLTRLKFAARMCVCVCVSTCKRIAKEKVHVWSLVCYSWH